MYNHISTYICVCMHIYIYIYIYIWLWFHQLHFQKTNIEMLEQPLPVGMKFNLLFLKFKGFLKV